LIFVEMARNTSFLFPTRVAQPKATADSSLANAIFPDMGADFAKTCRYALRLALTGQWNRMFGRASRSSRSMPRAPRVRSVRRAVAIAAGGRRQPYALPIGGAEGLRERVISLSPISLQGPASRTYTEHAAIPMRQIGSGWRPRGTPPSFVHSAIASRRRRGPGHTVPPKSAEYSHECFA